jgi:hypothetical protein
MYDYITCEYPLPTEELESAMESPPNWNEVEFQTKSLTEGLGGFLDLYTIEDDGQLYVEKKSEEWVEDEAAPTGFTLKVKDEGIEKQFFSGELRMYGMHMEEENDFYFDFKALFWKGELKELELQEWKKENNEFRKNAQEQLQETLKKMADKKDSILLNIYTSAVRLSLGTARYLLGSIVKLSWKIERWLT